MTARIEGPGELRTQECWRITAGTGQPGQDRKDSKAERGKLEKTVRIEWSGKETEDRTTRTLQHG
jgi:hypothetical protein